MILTDREILWAIEQGEIKIEPFNPLCLGSNSYDVHLSPWLAFYQSMELDVKKENKVNYIQIPEEGKVLKPGRLYLASTVEYTETWNAVPFLEGKSSAGRLGINIHATAGKGDVGFCNYWTMELYVVVPVRVYAGMPIGQLIYHRINTIPITHYSVKGSAKYTEIDRRPQPSMMFKNFKENKDARSSSLSEERKDEGGVGTGSISSPS